MHIEDTKFNETACVPTCSGQEKNGKNSEGSGWFQGRGGEEIHRNWMSTAIISISVIRVA